MTSPEVHAYATRGERSLAERMAALSTEERRDLFGILTDEKAKKLLYDWAFWARPDQMLPTYNPRTNSDNWFVWALISGRGAGKTRTGAETIRHWVGGPNDPPIRIALIAESAPDARDVMVEGESGIMAVSPPWNRPQYQPSKRRIVWPNGSVGTTFSGDKPDQLRGPQFHKAWVDEIAKFQYPQDVWDNLELGLRLGDKPQAIVTTTPRPIPVIKEMIADPMTVVTTVSTYANIANLAPHFIRRVLSKYEGTRLGEQELHAKILLDIVGALWTWEMIEKNRIKSTDMPALSRVVVAVDPAVSSEDGSNETGIVVCGKSASYRDQHGMYHVDKGFVLRDLSGNYTPTQWATVAIRAYHDFGANRIVAEKNQGGEMIRTVIHGINANIPVTLIPAVKSKPARAEPIAGLMEQGRIKHLGNFPVLEDQMTLMDREDYQGGGSPDRCDAMVHGMRELMRIGAGSSDPDDYESYRAA